MVPGKLLLFLLFGGFFGFAFLKILRIMSLWFGRRACQENGERALEQDQKGNLNGKYVEN